MRVIAFYLPQFHPIPENDKWWGNGFTEWTNTRKATPNFKRHYQPHIPLGENYYDLLDTSVQEWQVQLAKEYGIYGFCYYHYWFKNGKKLLEKPLEKMLGNKDLQMPFCLCWANETWSRRWDGSEKEILIQQDYGNLEDWKKHYDYLRSFFSDDRYIKVKGNPLLVLYKPSEIPNLSEKLNYWNELARRDGYEKIVFCVQYPQTDEAIEKLFDYVIEFEPQYTTEQIRHRRVQSFFCNPKLFINVGLGKAMQRLGIRHYKKFSYRLVAEASSNRKLISNHIPGAFPGWDNTARKKDKSDIYYGSTPQLFKKYLTKQAKKIIERENECDFLFINAWNEWAEGAHLEPDQKYGFQYLEVVESVIKK